MLQIITELSRNVAACQALNCVRIFSSASDSAARIFEVICGQVLSSFLPFILFPLSFLPERCHTDPFRSTVFSPALFCQHAAHIPHLQCNYCDFVCKHEKPSVPHPAVAPLSFFLFFFIFYNPFVCRGYWLCVYTPGRAVITAPLRAFYMWIRFVRLFCSCRSFWLSW